MLMMICLTISVGAVRSIRRLWMRISYRSHVLEPSPQGVLRVCCRPRQPPAFCVHARVRATARGRKHTMILRVLVGRRTGPLVRRSLFLARSISSEQTFSRDWTLREVRVMPIVQLSVCVAWACVQSSPGYERILWTFCSGCQLLSPTGTGREELGSTNGRLAEVLLGLVVRHGVGVLSVGRGGWLWIGC